MEEEKIVRDKIFIIGIWKATALRRIHDQKKEGSPYKLPLSFSTLPDSMAVKTCVGLSLCRELPLTHLFNICLTFSDIYPTFLDFLR